MFLKMSLYIKKLCTTSKCISLVKQTKPKDMGFSKAQAEKG